MRKQFRYRLKLTLAHYIVGLAIVAILLAIYFGAGFLKRSSLLPEASRRYDIPFLQVGSLAEVCPEVALSPPLAREVEQCFRGYAGVDAASLPDKFASVPIPDLERIDAEGRPAIAKLLSRPDTLSI